MYEGSWKDGKASGKGRMLFVDGDYYVGDWLEDKCIIIYLIFLENGYGEYYHNDGSVYKGSWENDLQEGEGVELLADNSKYSG